VSRAVPPTHDQWLLAKHVDRNCAIEWKTPHRVGVGLRNEGGARPYDDRPPWHSRIPRPTRCRIWTAPQLRFQNLDLARTSPRVACCSSATAGMGPPPP
jgi:hypothetical protein